MNIMKLFKKKPKVNYKYGAIVSEVIPMFHDKFRSSNKTFKLIDGNCSVIEAQNGKPIMFESSAEEVIEYSSKDLKHTGCPDFTFNGMRENLMYVVHGEGYMENYKNTYKVVLVTDRFVYSKNIQSESYPY